MELSICIPTYNSAKYLPDAIQSALRQDLEDFELVIIDNASKDDTESVVRGFADSRIRYFKNAVNLGSRENFNCCLEKASGKYIKFLCADDVLRDGIVLKQRDILRNRTDVSLVVSDMFVTDSRLRLLERQRFFPGFRDGPSLVKASLTALSNYIGGPSGVLFRRADAQGLSFDASYRWVADLKFEAQLLLKGSYINIDEPGFFYRRHDATDSATNCPENIRVPEFVRLAKELDCWNPLSFLLAVHRQAISGIDQVFTESPFAFRPHKMLEAATVIGDIVTARRHLKPIYNLDACEADDQTATKESMRGYSRKPGRRTE